MLKLTDWGGMPEMAYVYTPAATDRELAHYRLQLELDRERRNRNKGRRSILPLAGAERRSPLSPSPR